MNIKPQRDWLYLKLKKITKVGRIEIPDAAALEEEEIVEVLSIGPLVKKIKVGDKLIVLPREIIRHNVLTAKDEMNAFIREEFIVAVVT